MSGLNEPTVDGAVHDPHVRSAAEHAARRPGKLRRVVYIYEDSDDDDCDNYRCASGPADSVSKSARTPDGDARGGAADLSYSTSGDAPVAVCVEERPARRRGGRCCQCCHCGEEKRKKKAGPPPPRIGSPTPLGFYAFGVTTALYNVHTAGICAMNFATLGLVLFFGGLTQFVVGFFELINHNTLGCTISSTYGAFWMATMCLYIFPADIQTALPATQGGDSDYMGGFFLMWAFFAFSLFACAFNGSPIASKLLFFLVPMNFLLQSIGNFARVPTLVKVAGFEGIVAGSLAVYIGMALSMRDVYGFSVLPLGMYEGCRITEWDAPKVEEDSSEEV